MYAEYLPFILYSVGLRLQVSDSLLVDKSVVLYHNTTQKWDLNLFEKKKKHEMLQCWKARLEKKDALEKYSICTDVSQ